MSSPSKRRETELMKLMMNDYQAEMKNDEMKEFSVIFNGPVDNLVHIFEFFLLQLLKDPNADDAMNQEAANLLIRNKRAYDEKVKEYIQRFAKPEDVGVVPKLESSDEEPSDDYYSSEGEATAAGPAEA